MVDTILDQEAYSGADNDLIEVPDEFLEELSGDNDEPKDKPEEDTKDNDEDPDPKPADEEVIGDADHEPDPKPAPKKKKNDYQKRINEFSKETKTANEQRAAAETQRDLATDRAEKAEQELLKLRSESSTQREQDLLEQRKTAMDDGEIEKIVELGDEITQVRIDRSSAPKEAPPKPVKTESDHKPVHDSATTWINKNEWYNDPDHEDLAEAAESIEKDLRQSGMKIGAALYKELDKRLSKNPGYSAIKESGDEDPKDEDPEKPNHLAPSDRGGAPPSREKAGQLTQHDKRTMRQYQLDPNDPKHRAAYLKRKAG